VEVLTAIGDPPVEGGSACGGTLARVDLELPAGTYFVLVSASGGYYTGPYTLLYQELFGVSDCPCGNGTPDPAEECDDGNRQNGDCCSSACTYETDGAACTDDGNACTDDQCNGTGTCVHVPNTAPCDDSLFCNGADTCSEGSCSQHGGDPCVEGPECADTCNEAADSCVDPAGAPCTDDGFFCTGAERCDGAGSCTSAGDPCAGNPECADTCNEAGDHCADPAGTACAGDANACTDDACDGAGACVSTPNSAACDDADPCTLGDVCRGGACESGVPNDCDDSNVCTSDACDPGSGACHNLPSSGPCDDGDPCTEGDACSGGLCESGAPKDCDDGDTCTEDVCEAGSGECVNTPLDTCGQCGDVDCTADITLEDAQTVLAFDVGFLECRAPEFECSDLCDITPPGDGEGSPAGDGACNSGDALRIAQCDAGLIGCSFECTPAACAPPVGPEPPPDEEPCVVGCEVAGCSGDAVIADLVVNVGSNALGAYTLEFQCDPELLTIQGVAPGTSPHFSDPQAALSFTVDAERCHARLAGFQTVALDGPTGVVSVAQIAMLVKASSMGVETPLTLAVDSLFDTAGRRLAAEARGGSVTVGGCGNDAACNDGNACNGVESCNVETCQCQAGTPVVCTDGNLCTVGDTCNPATGSCIPGTPVECPDADLCNGTQSCNPATGTCLDGPPVDCDDGNACTTGETCEPATGQCRPGTLVECSDGNACNGVETCNPTQGCVPGSPPVCSDDDPCNGVETCDPTQGCVQGSPLVCTEADDNDCTAATCDPASGCVEVAVADGTACTPELGCQAGGASCQGGACTESSVCEAVEIVEVQIVPKRATKEAPPDVEMTFVGSERDLCQAQAFYELPEKDSVIAALATATEAKTDPCKKKIGKAENKARKLVDTGKKERAEIPITKKAKDRIAKNETQQVLGLKLNPVGRCLLQNAGSTGLAVRVDTSIRRASSGDADLLNHVVRLVQGGG